MCRRDGVTLMEVLVAIFIMGIGMLAMLVLFPLGVLRMAQAIQDERCSQAGKMANGIANFQGLRNDPWVLNDPTPNCPVGVIGATITFGGSGYLPPPALPPVVTFSNPAAPGVAAQGAGVVSASGQVVAVVMTKYGSNYTNGSLVKVAVAAPAGVGTTATAIVNLADAFTFPGGTLPLPADPDGPSYPVNVDCMAYFAANGQANQYWVGGLYGNSNTIPRRTATYAVSPGTMNVNNALTLRWTCLLDEMFFTPDGTPVWDSAPVAPATPGTFTRDIRYCCSYMLKRPRTSDSSAVDLSVIVYNNNRPILSSQFNEYLYTSQAGEVAFDPVSNSINIDVTASGNVVPPARPGDWLLDASFVPNQAQSYGTVNGNFYRVVGVTQNTDFNYTFEVQQPLRNMTATMNNPGAIQKVMFLEGVAEVFEKGLGRLP